MDLLLVRRLPPCHANVGKRLVKAPKIYVRDRGVLHALLGLEDLNNIAGHPVVGASWEGFTDLVLDLPKRRRWVVEIKHGLSPKLDKGFHLASEKLKPTRRIVVYSGSDRVPLSADIEAINVRDIARELIAEAAG